MGVSNRIILFLFSVIIAGLSILGIGIGLPFTFHEDQIIQFIEMTYGDVWVHVGIVSISLVIFFISLYFLWVSVRKSKGIDRGIDRETEIGAIRISLNTIEEIATGSGKTVKGVHDLTARVHFDEKTTSLSIGLKMIVDGKTPIQELSETLQQTVKNSVESVAGVEVDHVFVYVSRTVKQDPNRLRVS